MKHYFTLKELLASKAADEAEIDNKPCRDDLHNLWMLRRYVLDPLRHNFGKPIYVNSGYRCGAVNRLVGGSPYSYHLSGMAADLSVKSRNQLWTLFISLLSCYQTAELILYKNFIHVAFNARPGNRIIKIMSDAELPFWMDDLKNYEDDCWGHSPDWAAYAEHLPW